ncbi:unnamed protein product [Caenorhabditis sp. 36 PRJEB53466]|nr:unnamed protein product [Caenorhabditis sp. 36 PRJEB53466]
MLSQCPDTLTNINKLALNSVESLIVNVLQGQSELETLRNSYKTSITSVGKHIFTTYYIGCEKTSEEILSGYLEGIQIHFNHLVCTNVVKVIDDKWVALQNCYKLFMEEIMKESLQERCLSDIRKNLSNLILLAQNKLEEYSQRIMVMAEEHRRCKASFDDDLSAETYIIKNKFTSDLKHDFESKRIEKLRTFVEHMNVSNFEKCDACVKEFQQHIKKRKELLNSVSTSEKELRSLIFKRKKAPFTHFASTSTSTKTFNTSTMKLLKKS